MIMKKVMMMEVVLIMMMVMSDDLEEEEQECWRGMSSTAGSLANCSRYFCGLPKY